jgi:hypothetical protein
MIKILYANGDSWTAGEEIPYTTPLGCGTDKYYSSWPWYLSRELAIPLCINDAAGAGSNDRIYRKTTKYIIDYMSEGKDPKELLIVLGWTTPERTEIGIAGRYIRITSSTVLNYNLSNEETDNAEKYAKAYFNTYDETIALSQLVQYMLALKLLCEGHGINYYDFVAIGKPPELLEKIAKETFNSGLSKTYPWSWNDYCHIHNESRYENLHPTSETHLNWARVLTKAINI